ncbi:MAG: OsmC family protein [Deltaproteobacteria bacterium]|nr:OsmC family protein [Deltaproteobacteria bacterium]
MDLTVSFPGGKKVDAEIGGFVVRTDQPVSQGGEGSSPSPFVYCLAAMGTCAGIYVLSYLQARDLPTEGVRLVQRHHADPQSGKLTKISLKILLPPEIPEKHFKPIIRSAEKCAVKKLIEERPDFDMAIEVAGS